MAKNKNLMYLIQIGMKLSILEIQNLNNDNRIHQILYICNLFRIIKVNRLQIFVSFLDLFLNVLHFLIQIQKIDGLVNIYSFFIFIFFF
jgi:hypothetical protein